MIHKKNVCLGVWIVKNLDVVIFSDTVNVTKVKLCTVVLPIELDLLIPLSVTLAVFQGHSSVKHFQLKSFCFYMIKFKLCMIVNYIAYIMIITLFISFCFGITLCLCPSACMSGFCPVLNLSTFCNQT